MRECLNISNNNFNLHYYSDCTKSVGLCYTFKADITSLSQYNHITHKGHYEMLTTCIRMGIPKNITFIGALEQCFTQQDETTTTAVSGIWNFCDHSKPYILLKLPAPPLLYYNYKYF